MPYVIDIVLDVAAPKEVVWEVITDLPRYREWNPFCVDAKSTLKPGDPIEMLVKLRAKPQAVKEWIVDCRPGKGFSYSMTPIPGGTLSSLRSHDIDALDGTRSRYRSHFELSGWLRPLVLALFKPALHAGFAGMSEAVRKRAEELWAQRQSSQAPA